MAYASRIGGIGRAVETITPLLRLMGVSELQRMLEAENEPATAQRLGYIIETAGKEKLAEVIHDWLPPQLALIPLVSAKAGWMTAPVVEGWRVLYNSGEL